MDLEIEKEVMRDMKKEMKQGKELGAKFSKYLPNDKMTKKEEEQFGIFIYNVHPIVSECIKESNNKNLPKKAQADFLCDIYNYLYTALIVGEVTDKFRKKHNKDYDCFKVSEVNQMRKEKDFMLYLKNAVKKNVLALRLREDLKFTTSQYLDNYD